MVYGGGHNRKKLTKGIDNESEKVSLAEYEVHPISYEVAIAMIVKNHYLHRRGPASHRYGLFDNTGALVGCITYGKPANPSICKGICGPEESGNVYELTRLWIADITPKNAESFLIAQSLKQLPPEIDILISYAEIRAGHTGVVYQATNWIYTGLSDRHAEWHLDGIEASKHSRHLFDQYGGIKGAKEHFGERLQKGERPRKHRYVIFRGNKTRKKELNSKLRYEKQQYPK